MSGVRRLPVNESTFELGISIVILESPSKEFSGISLQLASVKELALELEISINANDEQLLKVSLAFNEYTVAGFLRRDGLYLNKLSVNCAVGTGLMRTMTAKSEFDFSVDLSEFSPDL